MGCMSSSGGGRSPCEERKARRLQELRGDLTEEGAAEEATMPKVTHDVTAGDEDYLSMFTRQRSGSEANLSRASSEETNICQPYRILAFDGGGFAGIVEIVLISRLLAMVPDLLSKVDMFAGTSTGSLIATGLATGHTPERIIDEYFKVGAKLMESINIMSSASLFIFNSRFSTAVLKECLHGWCPSNLTFRDTPRHLLITAISVGGESENDDICAFGERATTGLGFRSSQMVSTGTSVRTVEDLGSNIGRTWRPKIFHNLPESSTEDMLVVDAMLASSAAPTIFPTYKGFTDGGLAANNPAHIAACVAFGANVSTSNDVRIFSIGSGICPTARQVRNSSNGLGGLMDWGADLVQITLDMNTIMSSMFSSLLLGERYFRLQPKYKHPIDLFDGNAENLNALVAIANEVDLAPAVEWLKLHWSSRETLTSTEQSSNPESFTV